MENNICRSCGKKMFAFRQINNLYYTCINDACKFFGLLKIDLKESLKLSKIAQAQTGV